MTKEDPKAMAGDQEATLYSNRIAKEVLPGLIKPLVWSVNVPVVNGAWVRLLSELSGRKDLDPQRLAKQFHYRAYFNMGEIGKIWEAFGLPKDSLEKMTMGERMGFSLQPKMMASGPRVLGFLLRDLGFRRRVEGYMSRSEPFFKGLLDMNLASVSDDEVLRSVDSLLETNREGAYHNILCMLHASVFARGLKALMSRRGLELEQVDWNSCQEELLTYYPHVALSKVAEELEALSPEARERALGSRLSDVRAMPGMGRLAEAVDSFLGRFGQLSESGNDFSYPPWREKEDEVLHAAAAQGREREARKRVPLAKACRPGLGRLMVEGVASRASRAALLRERMGSAYTLGYGTFRPLFLELGQRLAGEGALRTREDIFYISLGEVRGAFGPSARRAGLMSLVETRRREMEEASGAVLPENIFGEEAPRLERTGPRVLRGIATSRGVHRGRARLVRGMSDFPSVQGGEVVVIPFSDVSWSSVLYRASAIVSESGGVLSHSSILAREFGIPAVVSVEGALSVIPDGATVLVDGDRGEVRIEGRD